MEPKQMTAMLGDVCNFGVAKKELNSASAFGICQAWNAFTIPKGWEWKRSARELRLLTLEVILFLHLAQEIEAEPRTAKMCQGSILDISKFYSGGSWVGCARQKRSSVHVKVGRLCTLYGLASQRHCFFSSFRTRSSVHVDTS